MKDKKSDVATADRIAKIKDRQDMLEFKNNLLLCIIKSMQQKERNDEVLTR